LASILIALILMTHPSVLELTQQNGAYHVEREWIKIQCPMKI